MPVTKKRIKSSAGLRHRAAVGITEVSDAIAIIISEETGNISYSVKGEIKYNIQTSRLQSLLISDLGLDKE
jgi:diadenylate cyclase